MKPKKYEVTLYSYRGFALGIYMDGHSWTIVLPLVMIELTKRQDYGN